MSHQSVASSQRIGFPSAIGFQPAADALLGGVTEPQLCPSLHSALNKLKILFVIASVVRILGRYVDCVCRLCTIVATRVACTTIVRSRATLVDCVPDVLCHWLLCWPCCGQGAPAPGVRSLDQHHLGVMMRPQAWCLLPSRA